MKGALFAVLMIAILFGLALRPNGEPAHVAMLGDNLQTVVWKSESTALFRDADGRETLVSTRGPGLEIGGVYVLRTKYVSSGKCGTNSFWLERV